MSRNNTKSYGCGGAATSNAKNKNTHTRVTPLIQKGAISGQKLASILRGTNSNGRKVNSAQDLNNAIQRLKHESQVLSRTKPRNSVNQKRKTQNAPSLVPKPQVDPSKLRLGQMDQRQFQKFLEQELAKKRKNI